MQLYIYGGGMSTDSPRRPGARDRRRRHTRDAIVQAALDLAVEEPSGRLTAERIAERAGVSRRTFFNYFPSVESALFDPVQQLLRVAVERLEQIPTDVPLLNSLTRAMTAAAEEEPLERLGICAHVGARLPQLRGSDLEQWDVADALLSEAFGERYPLLDPFLTRCLTGAVIGACRAAVQEWDRAGGLSADDPAGVLHALLHAALRHVSTGFGPLVDAT